MAKETCENQAVKAPASTACPFSTFLLLAVRPLYLLGGGHLQGLLQDGGAGNAGVGLEAAVLGQENC